jgi:leucyl-tRNA synthetase
MLTFDEPFERLMNQGILLNHIFFTRNDKGGKEYLPPPEIRPTLDAHGHIVGGTTADGTVVEYGGVGKMGKTERNGVDPQDLIDQYGADTARLFVMFVGGPEDSSVWSDTGVAGSARFLQRLWQFAVRHRDTLRRPPVDGVALGASAKALRREIHLLLKQVIYDYERMQYNTVASGAMKLLNALEDFKPEAGSAADAVALREGVSVLLRVLYPACPHITQVLWQQLGFAQALGDLLDVAMPTVDEAALLQDEIELVLQIAGKTRGSVRVAAQADKAAIERTALASPEFAKFGEGKAARKVVIVPGRLVNVVV